MVSDGMWIDCILHKSSYTVGRAGNDAMTSVQKHCFPKSRSEGWRI